MKKIITFWSILIIEINILIAVVRVQLPDGWIEGFKTKTFAGKTYYSFQGIPYAAPPTGNLRFQPPQPTPKWDGILKTKNYRSTCFQINERKYNESEDCLFLNIHTPQLQTPENNISLPVIFIHPSGLKKHSGSIHTPYLFMHNNVILVSLNYRLGVFGFLSTQDDVISGNYGLKDIQFALKWIYRNIDLFGGNPELITILGQIPGSALVSYQLLNPENKGLIKGAIMQSGSCLNPWAFQRKAREIAFNISSHLEPTLQFTNNSQQLLDFLLTVEAEDLNKVAEGYTNQELGSQYNELLQGYYFAPVIEVEHPTAFLTEKMYSLLKIGKFLHVPVMIGTTLEKAIGLDPDPDKFMESMSQYDKHLDWLVPNNMQILDKDSRFEMGRKIREIYTGGEPLSKHVGSAIRFFSDSEFSRGLIKHAELVSRFVNTYFYIFSYDGILGESEIIYEKTDVVSHTEIIEYLFCLETSCDDSMYPLTDGITRQRIFELWINFAKYQNPTPEPREITQYVNWPIVDIRNGNFFYLDFGVNLTIKNHPKQETYSKWTQLYDSLDYQDFDTY